MGVAEIREDLQVREDLQLREGTVPGISGKRLITDVSKLVDVNESSDDYSRCRLNKEIVVPTTDMPVSDPSADMNRANLDVENLLKIILALVIVWLVLQIVLETLGFLLGPFGPLSNLIGLVIVVLIILYFVDAI